MSTFVSGKSNFVPPPAGLHSAVCVDVVDVGMVQTNFGPKQQVRLVWEIAKLMPPEPKNPQVRRPYVASKWYTKSIAAKAQLRKDLEGWRGKAFTADELDQFDLDVLLNKPCKLLIQPYQKSDGSTSTKIIAITREDGKALAPSGFYERVKDRMIRGGGTPMAPAEEPPASEPTPEAEREVSDNIPF